MTKKDYIAIAAALNKARDMMLHTTNAHNDKRVVVNTLDHAVYQLADALASDNPLFDKGRFYTACGVN